MIDIISLFTMAIVIKEQLCGKDCEGCPHGPYAWRVTTENGEQQWKYLGPAGAVDGTGDDYDSDLTNTREQELVGLEEVEDKFDRITVDEDGVERGIFEIDDEEWTLGYNPEQDNLIGIKNEEGVIATLQKKHLESTAEVLKTLSESEVTPRLITDENAPDRSSERVKPSRIVLDNEWNNYIRLNGKTDEKAPDISQDVAKEWIKSIDRNKTSDIVGSNSEKPVQIEADEWAARIINDDRTKSSKYGREYLDETEYESGEYETYTNGIYEVADSRSDRNYFVYHNGEKIDVDEETVEKINRLDTSEHDILQEVVENKE